MGQEPGDYGGRNEDAGKGCAGDRECGDQRESDLTIRAMFLREENHRFC
jgi:hypothetical protein